MRLILLILMSVCYADVIHVPADYSTIQEGIDAAAEDDIVVVSPATYEENIIIDKTITLTSLALFNTETETIIDSLDTWFEWGTGQYDITNDSILTTIIDGSQPVNDSLGSTILIKAADDDCISPKILGFTITGGKGTLIDRAYVDQFGDTYYVPQYLGGGLFSYVTTPDIRYNYFYNNGSMDIEEGGAVYAVSDPDDCPFPTRSRCEIDEIDFSHNFFRDNTSRLGKILANRFFDDEINLSNCVFDYYCEATGNPNMYWVKVDEPEEVDYEETTSDGCPIDWDVWVSPDGSDDSETGFESEPFQTINWALSVVVGTESNPVTINLTEGTFAPSTNGETYSIIMQSNINLIGQSEEVTILDAEQTDRVITMEGCQNNIISDLTITGGNAVGEQPDFYGGGMYLDDSDPTLTHVTISGNSSDSWGGGINVWYSNPTLTYVTISDNSGYNGGGMYLYASNPTLTHVTISGNSANYGGGGMGLYLSNLTLIHVTITGNTADNGGGMKIQYSTPTLIHVAITGNTADYGGGMYVYFSNPTLTNVTISGNSAEWSGGGGGGMLLYSSSPTLTNSIIWDNSPAYFYIYSGTPIITYSDIEDGWEGEGNIDSDPLFNEDYTLQEGSPCIDSGDSFIWYSDIDNSRSDMGLTGGLYTLPNFIFHDFEEVGDLGSNKQFNLYNYREADITIEAVEFTTSAFSTNTAFPIIISPLQTGIINIQANNSVLGFTEDEMELISEDLPEGISIDLTSTGLAEFVLHGNLSGTYPSATYRILGDLTIISGDTVIIEAGTEFLFDGEYDFNIYGTLKAIGTEADSIIFDNFADEKWRGFTLEHASDETAFEYVRISGAKKSDGGGIYLRFSNPTLSHMTISGNTADYGGGIYLRFSNPTLSHMTISGNSSVYSGGGMRLVSGSNPTLTYVTISGNTAEDGGGMGLVGSNPTLTHVTISGNTTDYEGGGMRLSSSNPTLTNSIIWDNSPESIYIYSTYSIPIITYSDIEGDTTWTGEGNINTDPLFIDPENADYTLQEDSPCIDAGMVLEGIEYCGEAPDMGAYEYFTEDCLGCTDEIACNYDDTVISDDGSCEYFENSGWCDCDGNVDIGCGCGEDDSCLSVNELIIPDHYSISNIYPNPFNPITSITYGLPENGTVTLNIYTIQGRQVQTLLNDFQSAGYHTINWNASYYPSGVYLIRMESGSFTQTQKVVLVK